MKRLLAVLLILAMMLSAFAGCGTGDKTTAPDTTSGDTTIGDTTIGDTTIGDTTDPDTTEPDTTVPETTEPEETAPGVDELKYIMDQEMVDGFYDLLEACEQIFTDGTDLERIDEVSEQLDEYYYEMSDQSSIAYLFYCTNVKDETLSKNYLDSTDIMTEAYDAYMEMVRRVYLSETPAKDHIFADWTEQDIQELINYTGEVADLEARNAEITVEYRALSEEEFDEGMAELYNELVKNNNRIAQIYGYDNYYEYAYEQIYDRDYEHDSIVTMRGYVADYLILGASNALYEFNNQMSGLSASQQMELIGIMYNSYKTLKKDYVAKYLKSIPESSAKAMSFMFDQNRAIFTKAGNAEQGAFTTDIAGRPYCYFGPGYDGVTTVIHELGHFYAAEFTDLNSQPLDLAETHSQSNEWLFIKFLDDEMNKDVYKVLVEYKLYEAIAMIAVCTMVDQFEELVYTHPKAGNLTLEELNGLMSQVMEEYGGENFISNNISDMQYYWKMVVIEQPVYYISYAVSSIAALNIYTMSLEDEDAAWDAYIKLVEQMDTDQGFLWNIEQAGLAGPFDEDVYQDLVERYE